MSDMTNLSDNYLLRFIRDLLNENKNLKRERSLFHQEEKKIIDIMVQIHDYLDDDENFQPKNILDLLENISVMVKHLSFDRDCLVQELEKALRQIKDLKQ